jgi:hypothetical protein
MKGNYRKVGEVEEEQPPEPKATKQYLRPIGPEKPKEKEPKATIQYDKPIGPKEPKSVRKERDLDGDEPVTKEEIRQFKKEEREEAKRKKQPSVIQNIGRNVGGYIAKNNGQPSWMNKGGGMPAFMRMGGGTLPPVYTMPTRSPPAWLMGGIPGAAPVALKGKRKSHPAAPNGLPDWFRY